MKVEDVQFKDLRELIKKDRSFTDITKRHTWLNDKWIDYKELEYKLQSLKDNVFNKIMLETNWNELNKKRKQEGLLYFGSLEYKKGYIYSQKEWIILNDQLCVVSEIINYIEGELTRY